MHTKIFRRLSYLLFLFQISCFVALQRIPLHSSSLSGCSDAHKKIDVICNIHSGGLEIEQKNLGNEILVCGFIREFEPKVENKIIPDDIKNLCVDFSRRMLPCNCIKKKYRKLDIDEYRKKAIMFFLMYKIEGVQYELRKTIFHCACEDGHLGLSKLLKELGANIHAKDKDEDNALHLACFSSGSVEMVKWLLDVCEISIESKGYYEKTPFLSAAQKGHLAIAKLLREQGANIHTKGYYGNNALHEACKHSGSVAMVTWLVDVCKIDIEAKEFWGQTPFLYAANKGELAITKLLKERGANVEGKDKYGQNALYFACRGSGSEEMVTWLLDVCKIGVKTKNKFKQTPFLCAAQRGYFNIAKLLKKHGANVHAKDRDGYNALWYAKKYANNKELVSYLRDDLKLT